MIPGEILSDGNITESTSSFPYQTEGPIDFSRLNFVNTCQKDYYYGTYGSGTPSVLISEVTQCYKSISSFWTITGITGIIMLSTIVVIWAIQKRNKTIQETLAVPE